ncbi:hypothetical protein RTCIAT899_PC00715 (plasmid) [Rhizobium tropici CIAT 899]|nr:hypothetical protein RTCIAT899_PC00715 [Rhizobium tropici CIAT 899]
MGYQIYFPSVMWRVERIQGIVTIMEGIVRIGLLTAFATAAS